MIKVAKTDSPQLSADWHEVVYVDQNNDRILLYEDKGDGAFVDLHWDDIVDYREYANPTNER